MSGQIDQLSRSTFRSAAGDVAWQKQLRDRYADEGAPPVPHLDIKKAIVRPVSRRLAEQIILKYEWLGTMAQTGYHYGLFFGSYCAGVCCVAAGGGTGGVNSHMEWHLERNEFATLARGACVHWAPLGSNSKLVSWTCRLLPKDAKAKLLIAYSDTDAGEIGTIYQACNWACVGKGASTTQWLAPNGRIYDQKLPYDMRRREGFKKPRGAYVAALRDAGWTEQKSNPKFRYVCVLDKTDKALIDRVENMRQPYPKRVSADEATKGAPGTNQEREVQILPVRSILNSADATGKTPALVTN